MHSVNNQIKSEVLTVTALAESKAKLCKKVSFQTPFESINIHENSYTNTDDTAAGTTTLHTAIILASCLIYAWGLPTHPYST